MSAVEIHGMALSAPCRICYLACEAIGIEYKMVDCDLMNGGNKTPEYLKVINIYWFDKLFLLTFINCHIQSNLAIRNILVALEYFLNAKSSLSLWSKW